MIRIQLTCPQCGHSGIVHEEVRETRRLRCSKCKWEGPARMLGSKRIKRLQEGERK